MKPSKKNKKEIKSLLKKLSKIDMMYLPHEQMSKEDQEKEKEINKRLTELNVLNKNGQVYCGKLDMPNWLYKIVNETIL